tara:strand:- start:206 stop:388 length:183 start_codon:yes stop_codon:yes gene_type:complete
MRLNDKNKSIKFDSLEECISLKNYLISFIKKNKREIYDKGNDPELIINIKNLKHGKKISE